MRITINKLTNAAWHDIDERGRKLAAIIKCCNTNFYTAVNKNDYDTALSFLDRLIKTEHTLQVYVEIYNGVTKYMKKKRKLENTIQFDT